MPIRHSKNTRAVLNLNSIVYAAVLDESEAIGFSPSEIISRVLYQAGYGKRTKSAEKSVKYPLDGSQWFDEPDAKYALRRRVEQRLGYPNEEEWVLEEYRKRRLPEIIYWDMREE